MQLWEMTDHELRAELARTEETSNRYDEIMAELEDRTVVRRSMCKRRTGWHSVTEIREGS